MKNFQVAAFGLLLVSVLSLEGCAWTSGMWGKIWGDDENRKAEQNESMPKLVQSAEVAKQAPEPTDSLPGPGPETTAPAEGEGDQTITQAPTAAPEPMASTSGPEPQPAEPSAPEAVAEMTLSGDALFAFGKSDEDSITAEGRQQLDELVANLMGMKDAIDSILVIGYADRLGSPRRNLLLSEQRAVAVKNYLSAQGVDAALIQTDGRGSADAKVECPGTKATQALIRCLAPNRRVEVIAQARK